MHETISPADISNDTTDAERIRNEHIKLEATIKSVGILYIFGAVVLTLVAITGLIPESSDPMYLRVVIAALFFGLAVLQYIVGLELRRLKPWAKIAGIVLSCIGLLSFPIGTLIHGYILCQFLNRKTKRVFSEEYKEVIAATPQVRYKTSIVTWIILGILFLVLMAIIIPLLSTGVA